MASRAVTQFRPLLRAVQANRFKSSYEIIDHPSHGKIPVAKFRGATLDGAIYDGWPGTDAPWGGRGFRSPVKFLVMTILCSAVAFGAPEFMLHLQLLEKDKQ